MCMFHVVRMFVSLKAKYYLVYRVYEVPGTRYILLVLENILI